MSSLRWHMTLHDEQFNHQKPLNKMEKFNFKHLLLLLLVLLSATGFAHDFEVDGIYYDINRDKTSVTVTYRGSSFFNSTDYSGVVTIPSTVTYDSTTYDVTVIGYSAFAYCKDLTRVNIPNSVKTLDNQAFRECRGLTSVTVPSSVTKIGTWTFLYCYSLKSFVVEEGNPVYY